MASLAADVAMIRALHAAGAVMRLSTFITIVQHRLPIDVLKVGALSCC